MDELIGWHFSTGTLGYGDGRKIVIGETHTVDTTTHSLTLCKWGLHASEWIIDALKYAPGPMVYRVRLHGEILRGDDKACATHRTYIAGIDATGILRDFARKCALGVIHLWDAPDIVRQYLETGDESLRAAARDAASAAASDAAWGAAWAAARDAAWDAAWTAAWDAARAEARAAARAEAWDAARDAAWTAAWTAASDAAWGAQNTRLTKLVEAAMGTEYSIH
jgi:hypothetical protein